VSQISSGFQRAGSGVVRICSHLHLPPSPPPPRAIIILAVASIASPCVSVSLILEWSRGTRASSSDRYTLRRPYTYAGLANHDTDARDRRMTTSFHYHPPSFMRFAIHSCNFTTSFFYDFDTRAAARKDRWARTICRSHQFTLLDNFDGGPTIASHCQCQHFLLSTFSEDKRRERSCIGGIIARGDARSLLRWFSID